MNEFSHTNGKKWNKLNKGKRKVKKNIFDCTKLDYSFSFYVKP